MSDLNPIDIDKITSSDADPEVIEVYRLLKRYKEDEDRQKWERDVYKRGWEVAWGDTDALWTEKEREAMTEKGQIPIAINDLAKGIQGSSAVASANKPGINVKPIGSSDLYISELFKRGFDYVWGQNDGNQIVFDVIKEAKTGSLGAVDVRYDKTKRTKYVNGKIVIISDNPLDYYFDKKSRRADKRDSHIIKAHLISRVYAKQHYDVTDDDLDFRPIPPDEQPGLSSAGKPGEDEYARMEAEKKKDTQVNRENEDQADVWEIEAWLIKTVKEYRVIAVDQEEGEVFPFSFDTKKEAKDALEQIIAAGGEGKIDFESIEKREQRIIVGKKLISSEFNPIGTDSDGDPVLPKILVPHDRSDKGFYTCPTYRGMEISRSRNKRRMQTIYVITKNVDAPIVASQGYRWVKDEKHGDVLEIAKDSPFPPSRLLPGTTSQELIQMEMRDEAALNDEFDMNDVMKGKLPPGVDSGKLVIALQDQAGMMSTPFIGVVESVIERIAKVVLAFMLKYWPRKMWERLIEPDEMGTWQPDKEKKLDDMGQPIQPQSDLIKMKWLQALELIRPADPTKEPGVELEGLDVKIVAGSTMPTNRMAKASMALEMVKGGLYDAEAGLNYIDDPYKDQIASRMKQKEAAMMQAGLLKQAGGGKK